jgi:hypothetical protein
MVLGLSPCIHPGDIYNFTWNIQNCQYRNDSSGYSGNFDFDCCLIFCDIKGIKLLLLVYCDKGPHLIKRPLPFYNYRKVSYI